MNTRVLTSLAMIAAASVAVGYGTFAYFSDTEVSNSKIKVGTLDLRVNELNEIFLALDATNWAPGDTDPTTIPLKNTGTLTGETHGIVLDWCFRIYDEVDAPVAPGSDAGGDSSAAPLKEWVMIEEATYHSSPPLNFLPSAFVAESSDTLDNLVGCSIGNADPGNAGTDMTLNLKFDPAGPNHLMGDSLKYRFDFLLRQPDETPLSMASLPAL